MGREAPELVEADSKAAEAISETMQGIVKTQFHLANANPLQMQKETIEFTAGYIAGFADVMAQACGAKGGQSLSMTICVRTMQRLYGNEVGQAMFMSAANVMKAQPPVFASGIRAGGEDANHFVQQRVPMKLADHLKLR